MSGDLIRDKDVDVEKLISPIEVLFVLGNCKLYVVNYNLLVVVGGVSSYSGLWSSYSKT